MFVGREHGGPAGSLLSRCVCQERALHEVLGVSGQRERLEGGTRHVGEVASRLVG